MGIRDSLLVIPLLVACSGAPKVPEPDATDDTLTQFSILQGITDETSTQISVVAPKSVDLVARLIDPSLNPTTNDLDQAKTEKSFSPVRTVRIVKPYSEWAAYQFVFENLELGKSYQLEVSSEDKRIVDTRILRTLDTKNKVAKIAIASCMDDTYRFEQKHMWEMLLQNKPDILFLIGDNVYADKREGFVYKPATPEKIWKRYVENRSVLELFKTKELVPAIATWDDHDYGINDGDKNYEHKEESLGIFRAFYAQAAKPPFFDRGPGVSSHLAAFGQDFVFFDGRTFRTPNGSKDKDQTHWGIEQENWSLDLINRSKQDGVAWLVNGSQFFGGYHPLESYQGNHPASFERILVRLKRLKKRVVFVSGDAHVTEIMKIPNKHLGYQTYELTSSGMHVYVFIGKWKLWKNPYQIAGVDDRYNFMILDLKNARPGKATFNVEIRTQKNNRLVNKSLRVN